MASAIVLTLRLPVGSAKLSKHDLHRLSEILDERISDAAEIELANLKKPDEMDNDYFEDARRKIKEAYRLNITITGTNHQQIFGTTSEVFNNLNYPDNVLSYYANSATALRGNLDYTPRNELEINLDFSPPAKFDFNTSPGVATRNESNCVVRGFDSTWCNGLFHELESFFKARTNHLPWIHQGDFWNLLFWTIGIPSCFWVVYRMSDPIYRLFSQVSPFVLAAVYLYVFMMAAHVFRAIFWYARWIWPKVEYLGGRNNLGAHRVVLFAVSTGLLSAIVYDVIKALL